MGIIIADQLLNTKNENINIAPSNNKVIIGLQNKINEKCHRPNDNKSSIGEDNCRPSSEEETVNVKICNKKMSIIAPIDYKCDTNDKDSETESSTAEDYSVQMRNTVNLNIPHDSGGENIDMVSLNMIVSLSHDQVTKDVIDKSSNIESNNLNTRFRKLRMTQVDTDSDDNYSDDDGQTDDEKEQQDDSSSEYGNKQKKKLSADELQSKLSRLKLKEALPLEALKSIPHLQISSSEESSDDDDDDDSHSDAELYGLIARGPIAVRTKTGGYEPYAAFVHPRQARYSRISEPVAANLAGAQSRKKCSSLNEDLNDIKIPDSERKVLKGITPEELKKLNQEFSISEGNFWNLSHLSNGVSKRLPHLSDNIKSVIDSKTQFTFNIPANGLSDLCIGDIISENCPSEAFDCNQTYWNRPLDDYSQNYQAAYCSPASNLSTDSAVRGDKSSNPKKSFEDEFSNTSDYGSPSASTSEFSPASSNSPDYANNFDLSMYPSTSNPGAYIGTFDINPFSQTNDITEIHGIKMNVTGEENLFKSCNNLQDGVVTKIPQSQLFLQTHLCPELVSTNSVYGSLPNTKQGWNNFSTRYNHSIKTKAGVLFPIDGHKDGKMLMFVNNTVGQKVSCSSVTSSPNVSNKLVVMQTERINYLCNGSGTEQSINSVPKNSYRQILQVSGPQVFETAMQRPGYNRLSKLCQKRKKKSTLLVQWVTTLVETGRLSEQKQSMILIELLNQLACLFGDKPMTQELQDLNRVWAEKFLSTVECIYQLLKKPAVFSNPDSEGNTPLKVAALDNYKEPLIARVIADCIVKAGGDPDEMDEDGNSLLHSLCERGDSHANVIAELLNVKNNGITVFDVNRVNCLGQTPLHIAVKSKLSVAVVKVLIKHDARIDVKDFNNSTTLHIALHGDYDLGLLRTLLNSPSCHRAFNIEDNEKNTPLMIAGKNMVSKRKQLEAIQLLLISGANKQQLKFILSCIDPSRKEDIKNILLRKKK